MKPTLLVLLLAGTTVVASGTWRAEQADIRVIRLMTVGGSFEARTTSPSGPVTARASRSPAFD